MGRGEYDYIKGSTATNPSRKTSVQNPSRKYKETHKVKQEKKLKVKKKNDRRYILSVAGVILCFGCVTILGDSRVYNMQKQVRHLNIEINKMEEENEALKVKILKFSSLSNIQESAEARISMVMPGKEDSVKLDFSKNYFESVQDEDSNEENKKEDKGGIITKIFGFNK
ncbi:MAG: cell division protein FtsL [Clostridium butyricum]|nr:cell division protein FtsL [Clostridium butyricum]